MTRAFLLSLLASTLIFSAGATQSQQPSPRPAPHSAIRRPPNQITERSEQQASADQRGSEQSPFIVKILPANDAQKETKQNTTQRPDDPSNVWTLSDKIAVYATGAGFLQFVVLAITVWAMIHHARRQLRAYVLPDNCAIVDGTMLTPPRQDRVGVPGVSMLIKNSGQTPAYKVVSWAQIAVIFMRDEQTALVVPPVAERFSNTVGASGLFNKALWYDRPLAANEIADIAAGVRAIYLYGRIEYRDAFKKKRFTNFRLFYTGAFPPIPNAIFHFSEQGNDAD
jgi:hypothetical protein